LLGRGGTGGGGKGRVVNLPPELTDGVGTADVDITCPRDTNIAHWFDSQHITSILQHPAT